MNDDYHQSPAAVAEGICAAPAAQKQTPIDSRRTTLWQRTLQRLLRLLPSSHPSRNAHHQLGIRGEELAYWFLRRRGYTILARNYRQPHRRGEIDLIGLDEDILVFVEVKTRAAHGEYSAEQAVNRDKRRHLIALGRSYARRRGRAHQYRFDVVAIYGPENEQPEIVLHKDAFRTADPFRYVK